MRKIVFYFLIMACGLNSFSQLGPGYLGKRFLFGYGFYFSPALLGSNGSQASIFGRGNALGGDMAFNSNHEGFLEFSFKNRTSIGLSCRYYHSTFDNSVDARAYTTDQSGYAYTVYGKPTGFYDIIGLNYSLYFKFYNKRYVAPWGRYFLMGVVVNSYKCFYDPTTMKMSNYDIYGNNQPVINDFGLQGQQFARGDLMFGWGRNRMIGNRFTVDYGINLQLIALGYILWDSVGESPFDIFSEESTTNLNYMERTSKRRVREVNRFNVFLKVGVLLF